MGALHQITPCRTRTRLMFSQLRFKLAALRKFSLCGRARDLPPPQQQVLIVEGSKDSTRTERVSGFSRTPSMNQLSGGTTLSTSGVCSLWAGKPAWRPKHPDVTPGNLVPPHATPSLAPTATAAQEALLDLRVRAVSPFSPLSASWDLLQENPHSNLATNSEVYVCFRDPFTRRRRNFLLFLLRTADLSHAGLFC